MRPGAELPLRDVEETVRRALAEDVGTGDLSASLVPPDAWAAARVVTRERAVLCGIPWFEAVFRQLDPRIGVRWSARDGQDLAPGQELCRLEGPARPLLTGERTALNFLQTLSGTATLVRRFVEALRGTHATLLDTRKTLPGLREAQKYAVRCGGGTNHRMGLFDGVLLKENHLSAAGSVREAVCAARERYPDLPVEVEVETLKELSEAIEAGAHIALLDNFSLEGLREAVALNAGRIRLEASGGFDLETVRAAALTGVDYISVGALTKHLRAIDFSMRFLA